MSRLEPDSAASWRHVIAAADSTSGVPVLTLAGRFGFAAAAELAGSIAQTLDGQRSLVLDLAAVEYISSAPLAAILEAGDRCISAGGVLAVASASDPVRLALEFMGAGRTVAIHPTREAALAATAALNETQSRRSPGSDGGPVDP